MAGIISFFVPKEKKFFTMLRALSNNVLEGAILLKEYISEYENSGHEQRKERVAKIIEIEHKCDRITHSIINGLNKSFITPFDREDIHHMTSLLDDVIDSMLVSARRMGIYKLKHVPKSMLHKSEIIHSCVKEILGAINNLENLKEIQAHCIRINTLENEADYLHAESLSELFDNNKSKKDPIEVIKIKEIEEILERTIDKCEEVSFVLENIVIKHG